MCVYDSIFFKPIVGVTADLWFRIPSGLVGLGFATSKTCSDFRIASTRRHSVTLLYSACDDSPMIATLVGMGVGKRGVVKRWPTFYHTNE